jgi:flagellar FliL protein
MATAPKAAPAKSAKPAPTEEEAPAPAPKSKKRLIIIVAIVLVLLLAGGGGAAWYFMSGSSEEATETDAKGKAKAKDAKSDKKDKDKDAKAPPVFVNLDPFTVNLASEGGDRFLQTTIVLQVADDKVVEQVKRYMPVLRNRILMLLSSKKPSELETSDGKLKLIAELVAATRESIPGPGETHGINNALLSSFVIQ